MKRLTVFLPVFPAIVFWAFAKPKPQLYDCRYIEKNLMYIPSGTFTTAQEAEPDKQVTVALHAFFLFNQEITNGFYCTYLNDLKAKNDTLYQKALPDTTVWRDRSGCCEPFVQYYLRHPAYAGYPVVGVSYEQAKNFCTWLTQRYNALAGRKYLRVRFDLPTEAEWEYAAQGGADQNIFPWGGEYLQNTKGEWKANFMRIEQHQILRRNIVTMNTEGSAEEKQYLVADPLFVYPGIAGQLNDHGDLTAPSHSYWPNAYGLYNLAGNVEEMVREKGVCKGGSWRDPGAYLLIHSRETYTGTASVERGFRIAMYLEI